MIWPFRKPHRVSLSLEGLERFIRAGGTVSLEEWAELPESVQDLLAEAGQCVWADRTLGAAIAHASPDGLATVASVVDGGALRVQVALERAAAGASSQLRGVA